MNREKSDRIERTEVIEKVIKIHRTLYACGLSSISMREKQEGKDEVIEGRERRIDEEERCTSNSTSVFRGTVSRFEPSKDRMQTALHELVNNETVRSGLSLLHAPRPPKT